MGLLPVPPSSHVFLEKPPHAASERDSTVVQPHRLFRETTPTCSFSTARLPGYADPSSRALSHRARPIQSSPESKAVNEWLVPECNTLPQSSDTEEIGLKITLSDSASSPLLVQALCTQIHVEIKRVCLTALNELPF